MTLPQRVLAISPHLDDAALSAGATLADYAAAGSEVHVCSLFAGVPHEPLSSIARGFHNKCGLPPNASALTVRINEDQEAMEELGVRAHRSGFLDAVYRRGSDDGWLCRHERAMFDDQPLDRDNLLAEIIRDVSSVLASVSPDLVLTCAAVGGHVDHRLTRTAVSQVVRRARVPMLLWEDLPYGVAAPAIAQEWPLAHPAPPDAWTRKWRAIGCYRTQVHMLWPEETDWMLELLTHAKLRGHGHPAEQFSP